MSFKIFFRRAKKSTFLKLGICGFLILLMLLFIAYPLMPYDWAGIDFANKNLAPFKDMKHIFGCDSLGRDILTRCLYGGRISLLLSISVVVFSVVIGTLLGLTAGMFGGWADIIIMRITEIVMSVPGLMLALCVVAVLGVNFTNLIIVMLITSWTGYCRLVRGQVMAIRNSEYVKASTVLGAKRFSIMVKQILPNCVTPIIIQASQNLGSVILMESGMSYLGCGVPLPTPAWGSMISDGRQYLTVAPWITIVPGIFLMFTVLSFNFLGDGLRDCLDPKNKN